MDSHETAIMTQPTPGFIDKVAHKISELGLGSMAIMLLEINKPLSFAGSQALLLGQPLLDIVLPAGVTAEMAALLADRTQIESLIQRLDALRQEAPERSQREAAGG